MLGDDRAVSRQLFECNQYPLGEPGRIKFKCNINLTAGAGRFEGLCGSNRSAVVVSYNFTGRRIDQSALQLIRHIRDQVFIRNCIDYCCVRRGCDLVLPVESSCFCSDCREVYGFAQIVEVVCNDNFLIVLFQSLCGNQSMPSQIACIELEFHAQCTIRGFRHEGDGFCSDGSTAFNINQFTLEDIVMPSDEPAVVDGINQVRVFLSLCNMILRVSVKQYCVNAGWPVIINGTDIEHFDIPIQSDLEAHKLSMGIAAYRQFFKCIGVEREGTVSSVRNTAFTVATKPNTVGGIQKRLINNSFRINGSIIFICVGIDAIEGAVKDAVHIGNDNMAFARSLAGYTERDAGHTLHCVTMNLLEANVATVDLLTKSFAVVQNSHLSVFGDGNGLNPAFIEEIADRRLGLSQLIFAVRQSVIGGCRIAACIGNDNCNNRTRSVYLVINLDRMIRYIADRDFSSGKGRLAKRLPS